jgi:phage baseplate assembly protein V
MTWFNRFRNVIRQEAQRATADLSLPRAGIVTHYDPARYCARVLLQPEGIQTGYLPIKTEFAGNGWRDYSPPSLGQVVDVHFQQGGKEAGYIAGCFYSAKTKPLAVPSEERWIVHKTGTAIKLTNDGNVLISAAADLRIEANNIKIHARQTYAFDANGQGQKWNGSSVETWQDNDSTGAHHNHAPPETP